VSIRPDIIRIESVKDEALRIPVEVSMWNIFLDLLSSEEAHLRFLCRTITVSGAVLVWPDSG
jgi:hypothetical protein